MGGARPEDACMSTPFGTLRIYFSQIGDLPDPWMEFTAATLYCAETADIAAFVYHWAFESRAAVPECRPLGTYVAKARSLIQKHSDMIATLCPKLVAVRKERGPFRFHDHQRFRNVSRLSAHQMAFELAWRAGDAFDDAVKGCLHRSPEEIPLLKRGELHELTDEIVFEAARVKHAVVNSLPTPVERLHFDKETCTVTLDGTVYTVEDPRAFLVYKTLCDAMPNRLTKAEIRCRVSACKGTKTIPSLIERLPPVLKRTVNQ
jgi:hypothetical protein